MGDPQPGDRVVVGMSGGVDSSVAAALLVEAGYEVVGISMRLWSDASASGCCSLDDFLDARRVAAQLGMRFYVMDFRDQFNSRVVEPFVAEYLGGRTPNPCARCNQFVKFPSLLQRARELGADWVATGHYARVRRDPKTGRVQLWAAVDEAKDQSYFLFAIEPDVLRRTLFPLGELTKAEVRARARTLRLPVAGKPESQEVCFVPRGRYASFVTARAGQNGRRPGAIVDGTGRIVARHNGIHHFTIGQRRGLHLNAGRPLYVTGIEPASGTVRVGPQAATVAAGLVATRPNWMGGAPVPSGTRLDLKIRSRFPPTAVTVRSASGGQFVVAAQGGLSAVAAGQAAVLYDGAQLIGGGWIERVLTSIE